MLRKIEKATVVSDQKVRLDYSGGESVEVDFAPLVAEGGIWAKLGDPAFFSRVSIGEGGRYLSWPGELEFCADALWLEGCRVEVDHARGLSSPMPDV